MKKKKINQVTNHNVDNKAQFTIKSLGGNTNFTMVNNVRVNSKLGKIHHGTSWNKTNFEENNNKLTIIISNNIVIV